MKLRPCIDIHDGRVKQIVGSTLRDRQDAEAPGEGSLAENYISNEDASYYVGIYREKGLSGGHIILLNSSTQKEAYEADRQQAFSALRAWPGGMQIGGGIGPDNADEYLDAGASHVIVTSYVFRDGRLNMDNLLRMEQAVGKDRLVLDLSCRRLPSGEYAVVTDRWQKFTDLLITEENLDMLMRHCDEFLIHAADVEGKRSGIEENLIRLLGRWQKKSGFPVTYAGGVHAVSDMRKIAELSGNMTDVTVGSALDLFGGDLTLDELSDACK